MMQVDDLGGHYTPYKMIGQYMVSFLQLGERKFRTIYHRLVVTKHVGLVLKSYS